MNGEKGQALPLAMLALVFGALVITPFLSHASSNILGSRTYAESIGHQNACDAGIEHAIWNLTNGTLAEQFSMPGDEVTYQLDETINGLTTTITITAYDTGGGVSGDIEDMVIDTLEYNTSQGSEPDIIHISEDIFAIAHRGAGSNGFITTVSINTNGIIDNSTIDTLEYDTSSGYEPDIIHISSNIYAIVCRGSGNDGYIKTVSIDTDGEISNSNIDSLEFDTSNCYEPSIIHVFEDKYSIVYRGSNNDGFIKTVSIDGAGDIGNSVIDSWEFDTSNCYEPSIIHVFEDKYAITYRGSDNDGFVKIISINTSGDISNSVIDSLEFDTSNGYEPSIIHASGDNYAIAYRSSGNEGLIKTISIDTSGEIGNSIIDSLEFDTDYCYDPYIIPAQNDIYAITYLGSNNDGFLKTVSINTNGDIENSVIDTLEFDTQNGYEPVIIHVSGDIYAVVYRGNNSDGFIKTVEVSGSGGSAIYEILTNAGDTSIRAYVNIDDETISIISWQIEQ